MGVLFLDRLGGTASAVEICIRGLLREVGFVYIAIVGFRWVILVNTIWIWGSGTESFGYVEHVFHGRRHCTVHIITISALIYTSQDLD